MKQYVYKHNEIDKMMFSELVLALALEENNEIYMFEIKKRLRFCNFEKKMINQIISYELEIIKTTKKKYSDLLINKKWWLQNIEDYFIDKNKKLLQYPLENYLLYNNGTMSPYALTNSEIVSIFDEANFILTNNINMPSQVIQECKTLSTLDSHQNIRDEFIHRIEYIYIKEN